MELQGETVVASALEETLSNGASYNLNFSQEESAHADSMAKLGQWSCKGKPWLHLDSKKVWLSGNLWASYNLKCSQQESAHADSAAIPWPFAIQ